MFPQPQDRKNYSYPEDGLLRAHDFVREAEMRNPQQLDVFVVRTPTSHHPIDIRFCVWQAGGAR
jgi:hypothetical protein